MKKIKCIVWDLDHTVWDGILSEDPEVRIRKPIAEAIRKFDERGILQAIASKNNEADCRERLQAFGLWDYFLLKEINWNAKSHSIRKMQEALNINLDTFAFIDDQQYERDEVQYELPQVRVYSPDHIQELLESEEFNPEFITADTVNRRKLYLADLKRKKADEEFQGTSLEFLKSLDMVLTLKAASEEDLDRIRELTVRTNQLNTTGYVYSHDDLKAMLTDDRYEILTASLTDRFGSYGQIGVSVLEKGISCNTIKLFLMSCRVMSKGIGTVFIQHIIDRSRKENKNVCAEFVETDRNRMMYVTYRFMGFSERSKKNGKTILEYQNPQKAEPAEYLKLVVL